MPQVIVNTKFWTFDQNNSGGSFDHNPEHGIGYRVCVEALSTEDAVARFRHITDSYPGMRGSCPCCGERWSAYVWDDDASDVPGINGEPLKGGWGIPSYVHFIDGRIEAREPEAA